MKNYIAITNKLSGEYRYRLTGPDGRIKQECGWTPNLVTDQGLDLARTDSIQRYLAIGTSDIAADVTQTSLQGTHLATDTSMQVISRNQPVGPNWERNQMKEATFGTGVGTGTIKEFILTPSGASPPTQATIRVVLTTPIVKGALDQLTIQHRITFWPFLGDVDSVIDISGVAYDVKMRHFHGLNNQNSMGITTWDNSGHNAYANATLPLDMDVEAISGSNKGAATLTTKTYGGTNPNFYTDIEVVYGIDHTGGTNLNVFQVNTFNAQPRVAALITKVSDGTGIDKANTHELRLNWRLYTARYTP